MLSDEIKKVPISEQKLTQMKKLIISAERQNLKTGEYATQDMVKVIRKIIEKNADYLYHILSSIFSGFKVLPLCGDDKFLHLS